MKDNYEHTQSNQAHEASESKEYEAMEHNVTAASPASCSEIAPKDGNLAPKSVNEAN